jgi:hypothetical protein
MVQLVPSGFEKIWETRSSVLHCPLDGLQVAGAADNGVERGRGLEEE